MKVMVKIHRCVMVEMIVVVMRRSGKKSEVEDRWEAGDVVSSLGIRQLF